MEADLMQMSEPSDPTEALMRYVKSGERKDLLRAVFSQPYLQDVPEALKVRLCDRIPGLSVQDGWKLLKHLPLSRACRRSLHSSKQWVVNLASGPSAETDPLKLWCQERNLQYLPIDVLQKGGKGWDLAAPDGVWSVLLWAACTGRVVAVLSSPPHRTWCDNDDPTASRTIEDLWGSYDPGDPGFKENLLAVQDMLLWSLASASRGSAIPYVKELPSLGRLSESPQRLHITPGAFWSTGAWKSFARWSRVEMIEFCQGSLGHSWLHPTAIATNLPLKHLSSLPKVGMPQPDEAFQRSKDSGWSIGFKKELVEALEGRVKGPTVAELDHMIATAIRASRPLLDEGSSESDVTVDLSAPASPNGQVVVEERPPVDVNVGALTAAQREEWRSHIMRGHLPYRRDCKFCVEGSGLGVQHRRIKNPQAFTLSIDLFGPMSGIERGRDEQSVSGNPHLKFGLVAVFRLPKSCIEPITRSYDPEKGQEGAVGRQLSSQPPEEEEDELAEYEPSLPGEPEADWLDEIRDEGFTPQGPAERAVETGLSSEPEITQGKDSPEDEEEWITDAELDEQIKDHTSGVELATLRYVVGLKSKTGADVAAGVQRLILAINKAYPVRVLHCDPGTEFTSDKLTSWLSQHGVRLQTTLPTDKQGNGVAERAVGWMKSRARTLLSSAALGPAYWPLAMRYAAEVSNRAVLRQPPLPAFGQKVLHKVKRSSGANKELLGRWVTASYAAPHLTVPDGHVLFTAEGNLVASKGFRSNLVDVTAETALEIPTLQEEEHHSELLPEPLGLLEESLEEKPQASSPSKRLREKTAVRFFGLDEDLEVSLDQALKHALLDEDYTESTFRYVMKKLEEEEPPSGDRRGDLQGRYVAGAFCHGGQRGVTTLARNRPSLVRFLNKFLKARSPRVDPEEANRWATVLLVHSSDVAVHRDYRNEWGTENTIVYVPGQVDLWTGPPHNSKISSAEIKPDWSSDQVLNVGQVATRFDARNYHALRCTPGWLVVGYTPLGIHKLLEEDKQWLVDAGFVLPIPDVIEPQVKAFRSTSSLSSSGIPHAASSSAEHFDPEGGAQAASSSDSPGVPIDLNADLQEDSVTAFIGWDPTGGNRSHVSQQNLEEADMYQFLVERGVEWTFRRLEVLGVESPADLYFLYVEDLIEFGLSEEDARKVMFGIHPEGMLRPDNPNGISLRTGEVRLIDRGQRQLPWAIQNRTLGLKKPGPPVPGLGVRDSDNRPDPYVEDWTQLEDPLYEEPAQVQPQLYLCVDLSAAASSSDFPPEVSSVFTEESPRAQVINMLNSIEYYQETSHHVESCGEHALNADTHALHSMRMQAIWEAQTDEEFNALVCPSGSMCHIVSPNGGAEVLDSAISVMPAEVSPVFTEESPRTQVSGRFSCKVVSCSSQSYPPCGATGSSVIPNTGVSRLDRSPMQTQVDSTSEPQFGVVFPSVISVPFEGSCQSIGPNANGTQACKVLDTSFTQNVEELLENLTGPLEVVHQVSPSEVKRHLEKWRAPAQEEIDSMEGMNAIVRHRGLKAKAMLKQDNVEVLPAKGVFTVKPGKPFRRKVRVVSCGNFAKSVAEEDLYASGAPAETLRTILVFAGGRRRHCWSTDIKCAFLLAPIPSTVTKQYILKPPSILVALGVCSADEYWQVCKAVYGFKEAPKWWSQFRDQELSKAILQTDQGTAYLRQTASDENLWEIALVDGSVIGHVLVYVDDLLILSTRNTAESFHSWVKDKWGCSDLDKASSCKPLRFLGVDIYEVNDEYGVCGYSLSQEGYIDELIRSHALEPTARATIPLPREWVKDPPPEESGYTESTLREAQRVTGELLWLSQRSRIDIAFSVGLMSSWTVRSPSFVAKIGLRVLSYLANTKVFRLSLVPDQTQELTLYSDASFAPFGERSISGIVILLCGRCVYLKSRRQTLMSLSTAECELIAACETVTLGQAIESLATDLFKIEMPKVLHVDNLAAITLAEGSGSQRTRHLRVRAHFLKELIEERKLAVRHCPGEFQRADALTKALPAPRLKTLNELLGIGVPTSTVDPIVNAVMSTSTAFQGVDPNEGQSMMLILALLMMLVTPAASQEGDEEPYDGVSLDLWIVGSLFAFLLLIIWETGKHCLGRCCNTTSQASVRAISAEQAQPSKRERRQEAVRRALEKETEKGLRRRNVDNSSEEVEGPTTTSTGGIPPPPPSHPPSSPRVARELLQEWHDQAFDPDAVSDIEAIFSKLDAVVTRAQATIDQLQHQAVPFASGSPALTAEGETMLKRLAAALQQFPQVGLRIDAYSGHSNDRMALELAASRGEAAERERPPKRTAGQEAESSRQVTLDMAQLANLLEQTGQKIMKAQHDHLEARMGALEELTGKRLASAETRIGTVEGKVDSMETKLDELAKKLERLTGKRLASAETRIGTVEGKVDSMETKLDELAKKLERQGSGQARGEGRSEERKLTLVYGGWARDTKRDDILMQLQKGLDRGDETEYQVKKRMHAVVRAVADAEALGKCLEEARR
eukprot:s6340_g2.t1